MASPFDVLQIDRDADDEEIERAYRQRVKEAHPDQGGSTKEFQLVRAAYEELKSREGREGSEARDVDHRDVGARRGQTRSRIEFLNYEVLADQGWSLDDEALFDKAATANLDPADYGQFVAEPDESLLEAAENRGFVWPFSCRGGACANCAVAVVEGELSMPVDHILPPELLERNIRLSCGGSPITPALKVVYNVKSLPELEDFRLPPGPYELLYADG